MIGCVGLSNQKYHILNTPCTLEAYESTLEKLRTDEAFYKDFLVQLQILIEKTGIQKHILTGSTDSTGDFLYDSQRSHECYGCGDTRDSAYLYDCYDTYDSMDINNWGESLTLSYDSIALGQNSSHIYWSQGSW